MNKIQPLDQVSSIVASALNQTAKIRKSFQSFFTGTMILILSMYGKMNFLSMARHGDSCGRRFRQNLRRPFDRCTFNRAMLPEGCGVAIALDHSFIPKAVKIGIREPNDPMIMPLPLRSLRDMESDCIASEIPYLKSSLSDPSAPLRKIRTGWRKL